MKALDITKLNEVSHIFFSPAQSIQHLHYIVVTFSFQGLEGDREFLFVPGFWILPLRVYLMHQYLGGYLLSFSMISE